MAKTPQRKSLKSRLKGGSAITTHSLPPRGKTLSVSASDAAKAMKKLGDTTRRKS